MFPLFMKTLVQFPKDFKLPQHCLFVFVLTIPDMKFDIISTIKKKMMSLIN